MLGLALMMLAGAQMPVVVARQRAPAPAAEAEAPQAGVAAEVAPEAPPKRLLPPVSPARMLGDWQLGLAAGGRACEVTLRDHAWSGGLRSATVGATCPEGFFTATRWRLLGEEVLLADRGGRVLARFVRDEDGAWQGRREADGVALKFVKRR